MLFTCRPLAGHYDPLVGLATAARDGGHQVAFGTGEPAVTRARGAGFEAFACGHGEDYRAVWEPRFPGYQRIVGDEGRRFFFTEVFVGLELERRAEDLGEVVAAWRPDVIVHEVAELAAPIVAVAAGVPYATSSYGPLLPWPLAEAAGTAAAPFWRDHGLEPDPLAGLYRYLYLDTCPPGLQVDDLRRIPAVQPVRPATADVPPGAEAPPWLEELPDLPTVYVTLGTVWNRDLGVFRCVLEALGDEELAVIVTVGHRNDPSALGTPRAHVYVERFIPQGLVLPRCDAVVTHGGAGSTLGALTYGMPLVMLPQGADQFHNAERVVSAGAGVQLLAGELSPGAVRAAVRELLDDPRYRAAAMAISKEIRSMPGPERGVEALRALAAAPPPAVPPIR